MNFKWLAIAAVVTGAFMVVGYQTEKTVHKDTLAQMLGDDERTKGVRVGYVEVPYTVVLPVLAPKQYAGYFTVEGDRCKHRTFDYSVRYTGGEYAFWVDGPNMLELSACA